MHRAGKLGSQRTRVEAGRRSGEVRAQRASAIAQDLLARHQDEIESALVRALVKGSVGQQIKAAEVLLRLALGGQRVEVGEAQHEEEQLSREQMLDQVALMLARPAGRLIANRVVELEAGAEPVITDAEVVP